MSQHDLNVANSDGATVRADLNNALVALGSLQTGAVGSIPDTQPNMIVADTTSGHVLKRNNADDAWDTLFPIDQRILASAAGTDTYAITFAPAINAYVNGVIYRFKADVANSGTCTLNINGVGAWEIQRRESGGALGNLGDNEILANQLVLCLADTTASKFVLLNPSRDVTSAAYVDYSATSTITGWSAYTTKQIYYKKVGALYYVTFDIAGTSDATTATFTLPEAIAGPLVGVACIVKDNGTMPTDPGFASVQTSTVTCYKNNAMAAWTNSGDKMVRGQFFYFVL